MNYQVNSEVGQLPQVILHRPGLEVNWFTPSNKKALCVAKLQVLTALQDVMGAESEQRNDGCNVLAVEPGTVVAYDRSVTSNEYLRSQGVEVLEKCLARSWGVDVEARVA